MCVSVCGPGSPPQLCAAPFSAAAAAAAASAAASTPPAAVYCPAIFSGTAFHVSGMVYGGTSSCLRRRASRSPHCTPARKGWPITARQPSGPPPSRRAGSTVSSRAKKSAQAGLKAWRDQATRPRRVSSLSASEPPPLEKGLRPVRRAKTVQP